MSEADTKNSPTDTSPFSINMSAANNEHCQLPASEGSPLSLEQSPWKKNMAWQNHASPEDLAKQAKVMAAPNVVHSNYVPSQLERHLEFMHFNSGKS